MRRRQFLIGASFSLASKGAKLGEIRRTNAPACDLLDKRSTTTLGRANLSSALTSQADAARYNNAVGKLKSNGCYDLYVDTHYDSCVNKNMHGLVDFLTWHRAFLIAFELECRRALTDPTFRLPCWDWDVSSAKRVPQVFLDANNLANLSLPKKYRKNDTDLESRPLFIAQLEALRVGSSGSMFPDFVDKLSGVHSAVHADVGAASIGYMKDVAHSPRDPIFYAHHVQVDRIFDYWLRFMGGAEKIQGAEADEKTKEWVTDTCYEFDTQLGGRVFARAADLIDPKLLDYSYDNKNLDSFFPSNGPTLERFRINVPGGYSSRRIDVSVRRGGKNIPIASVVNFLHHEDATRAQQSRDFEIVLTTAQRKKIGKTPLEPSELRFTPSHN